jgi:hypothetical protein
MMCEVTAAASSPQLSGRAMASVRACCQRGVQEWTVLYRSRGVCVYRTAPYAQQRVSLMGGFSRVLLEWRGVLYTGPGCGVADNWRCACFSCCALRREPRAKGAVLFVFLAVRLACGLQVCGKPQWLCGAVTVSQMVHIYRSQLKWPYLQQHGRLYIRQLQVLAGGAHTPRCCKEAAARQAGEFICSYISIARAQRIHQ